MSTHPEPPAAAPAAALVVALSGGVGGAKLAHGLALALPADALAVIVNTGDDFRHYGLAIAPDVDTVLYTLAGAANPTTGWGVAGDTDGVMQALRALGDEAWFHLGDRDLATHLRRTALLARGETATAVTARLGRALGVGPRVLPMTDAAVATKIRCAAGELDFQEWFVRGRCQPPATGVRYEGIDQAPPTAAVMGALDRARLIILGPSNPFLSLGPILALPGMRDALAPARVPVVAVSPIIGGQAIKGPAADMMRDLAGEASAAAVVRYYGPLVTGWVIDEADRAAADDIRRSGYQVLVADTVMADVADRERLAREVLAFGASLA